MYQNALKIESETTPGIVRWRRVRDAADQTSMLSQTSAPPKAYFHGVLHVFFVADELQSDASTPAGLLRDGRSASAPLVVQSPSPDFIERNQRDPPPQLAPLQQRFARLFIVDHDLVQSTASHDFEGRGVLPVAGRD